MIKKVFLLTLAVGSGLLNIYFVWSFLVGYVANANFNAGLEKQAINLVEVIEQNKCEPFTIEVGIKKYQVKQVCENKNSNSQ